MLALGIKKHFVLQQGNYIVFSLLSPNIFFLTGKHFLLCTFSLDSSCNKTTLYTSWEGITLLMKSSKFSRNWKKVTRAKCCRNKGISQSLTCLLYIPQSLTCLLYVSLGLFKTRCFRPGTIMKWIPANSKFYSVGVNVWDIVQMVPRCPDRSWYLINIVSIMQDNILVTEWWGLWAEINLDQTPLTILPSSLLTVEAAKRDLLWYRCIPCRYTYSVKRNDCLDFEVNKIEDEAQHCAGGCCCYYY